MITINGIIVMAPMTGVWQLQSDAMDDNKGVLQTLAAITGSRPEGLGST